MAAFFVIDRTWTPILQTAIDATAMVFAERLDEEDEVALYSLGQRFLIPPTKKGGPEASRRLLAQIKDSNQSEGSCLLYESMANVLDSLAKVDKGKSKWLIVLTDLVDLRTTDTAKCSAAARALLGKMHRMENLNVAIIDSEAISGYEPSHAMWPTWRANARMLSSELQGTNKGYHLTADNEQAIRAAFERVASMMGGMNEAL